MEYRIVEKQEFFGDKLIIVFYPQVKWMFIWWEFDPVLSKEEALKVIDTHKKSHPIIHKVD